MTTGTMDAPARIPDAEFVRLMELMRASDSVELKLTVPASDHRRTIAQLPIDPVEAQPRQVYFFDTPDLVLDRAGVVVRARRIQGGRGDTVVKLRPVVPSELPSELRHEAAFNVEVDAMPGGFVCSGSFKGRSTGQEVRDAVAGKLPIRKIFAKEQRRFFRQHAPDGIDLDALVPLGPTFVLKTTFEPPELRRRFVGEMWLYPDGSRILELSTKCLPNEAFQVAAECRSYLAGRGVTAGGAQQTKTRAALTYFTAQLGGHAPDGDQESTTPA
ncbi:MAG TPA: hypothetical protein VFO05_04810 [Candidatus Limnocylindrales bacterium]|nr:hypothetical protein [Candidatus Limnocylindrales bacterium]